MHPLRAAATAQSESASGSAGASRTRPRTARPPGQTRAQLAPRIFASRMRSAEPRRFPDAMRLMNPGTSMCVGHAAVHGASKQFRQRSASITAACAASARLQLAEPRSQLLDRPVVLRCSSEPHECRNTIRIVPQLTSGNPGALAPEKSPYDATSGPYRSGRRSR